MINSDETKTDRPRWLINVDEYIEEEQDIYPSVAPYYEIVRDMLLEPEDSDSAVPNAVTKFYDLHTAAIEEEMAKETSEPEKLAGYKLNTIADIAFEIARDVFYTTFEHERLAKLLIGIKKGAANEYDKEKPNFVYHGWGLERVAAEAWNASHVDSRTKFGATEEEHIYTEGWINISALLDKLYQEGLLDTKGPLWLVRDFEDAFEICTGGDITSDAGRQAQVLAVINHVLIAGEPFAREAKEPSEEKKYELDAAKWKLWASKIQEIAEAVGEDAKWDLKNRAKKAYARMVELYPQAF